MPRWGRQVNVPGFGVMFVDGSGPRPGEPVKCHYCANEHTKMCDWPNPKHKSGTCDRKLCDDHAGQPVPEFGKVQDIDFCPVHMEMYRKEKGIC